MSSIKKFYLKIGLVLLPFHLLVAGYITLDPFKVIWVHDDYYSSPLVLNRDVVSTVIYLKNAKDYKYNSFIFGSSRSLAFLCKDWKSYLEDGAVPFHFDASMESIYGIWTKIKFLDSAGTKIDNVLIVTDNLVFRLTDDIKEHLYIKSPKTSHESKTVFHSVFLKILTDQVFVMAFADYLINQKKRSFFSKYFNNTLNVYIPVSNDMIFGNERLILNDSIGYYKLHEKEFWKETTSDSAKLNLEKEKFMLVKRYLVEINTILKKHKTKFKIVFAPIYDQQSIFANVKRETIMIFGEENVYDFSGKNKFTSHQGNYYESSHFRPLVAVQILDIIY